MNDDEEKPARSGTAAGFEDGHVARPDNAHTTHSSEPTQSAPILAPLRNPLRDAFDKTWPIREQQLLGWFMRADDLPAAQALANDFDPSEFSEPLHATIFSTLRVPLCAGRPLSISELNLALVECSALTKVKGIEYLEKLFRIAPGRYDGRPLAAAVRDMTARGQAATELYSLSEDALRAAVPLDETARRLTAVQDVLSRAKPQTIIASPYVFRHPTQIPPRRPLFESRHAHIGSVSLTNATGGTGKSSLLMVEQLAHVTGRNLLNDAPFMTGRAWHIALEDEPEEHERRLAAAILHHKIDPADLAGRFFLDTPQSFCIARVEHNGTTIATPLSDSIIREIKRRGITSLAIDPFVKCHRVPENDNTAIAEVAGLWAKVAREGGCAVDLSHHNRKATGNSAASADDLRGAVSLRDTCRSMRMLRGMTETKASEFGIAEHRRFFSVVDGKKNMSAYNPDVWREMVILDLGNARDGWPSDRVAVVAPWNPQTAFAPVGDIDLAAIREQVAAGSWRFDPQALDWVGRPVAQAHGIDITSGEGIVLAKKLVAHLIGCGELQIVERRVAKDRKKRKFVEVI